jgi:hypothetical protein
MDDAFVWTTHLYGRPVCMDDADLYGRRITKRAILVDDAFWWTMDFVWTTDY